MIKYSAEDENEAKSFCSFTIQIDGNSCGEPPALPKYLEATKVACRDGQLSYSITCVNGGTISSPTSGILGKKIRNICLESLETWSLLDFVMYQCSHLTEFPEDEKVEVEQTTGD